MKTKPVWKRAAPAKAKHHALSPSKKAAAKRSAKRAGRSYPNLVDNMRAARTKTQPTKAKSAKRKSPTRGARKKT